MSKKVVIVQYRLLHYRVALFQKLKQLLSDENIDLNLVYGQPSRKEAKRKDVGQLDWAYPVKNRFLTIGNKDILWQPLPKEFLNSDLIIFMQENRILSNYPLILKAKLGLGPKVAYWGHGKNYQSTLSNNLRERWKRLLLKSVNWWFAYTEMTKAYVLENGYPAERITCLNNAIDNESLIKDLDSVTPSQLNELRLPLGLTENSQVGLFCGSLYAEKKLELLIASADLLNHQLPDFHLIVIGDGPDSQIINNAQTSRPWLHWVGIQKGSAKAKYFKLAHVILNPGLVGLHVLDAFAAGLPMITTNNALHSPEIAYLQDGVNGLITHDTPEAYAAAVFKLLSDQIYYNAIANKALEDSRYYTLEKMVQNFAEGIKKCIVSA